MNMTSDELDDYVGFFPRLLECIELIQFDKRQKRLNQKVGRPTGFQPFLEKYAREHERGNPGLGKRVKNAKERLTTLSPCDFRFICGEVLESYVGSCLTVKIIADLKRSYRSYNAFQTIYSPRRNSHRMAGLINDKSIIPAIENMAGSELMFKSVIRDPRQFYDFIRKWVHTPAHGVEQGAAMRNAYMIYHYTTDRIHEYPNLSDHDLYCAFMAETVRTAAWAAQQVGQWEKFEYFHNIMKALRSRSNEKTVITAAALCNFYSYNRSNSPASVAGSYQSSYASEAAVALISLPETTFSSVSSNFGIIHIMQQSNA